MYGVPNTGGVAQGLDPNAPPRPVNFVNWQHKGGLFAGYMAPLTMDQSGIARVQIYATLPTVTNFVTGSITFYVTGHHAAGAVTSLWAAKVATTDANYSVAPSAVTWTTRWQTFDGGGSTSTGEISAGYYSLSIGTTLGSKYVIGSANETSLTTGWTYLCSPSYEASHSSLVEAKPRIWILDKTGTDTYYGTTVNS
jgi:hypothetical protein